MNLLTLEVTLGVAVVVVVVCALVLARWVKPQAAPRDLSRGGRFVVALVAAGSAAVAMSTLAGAAAPSHRLATAPSVVVDGLSVNGSPTPEVVEELGARVTGGYESVWLMITDPAPQLRVLLILGEVLPALLTVLLSAGAAWLAIGLLRGRPFGRALPGLVGSAAGALILAQTGSAIARSEAGRTVLNALGERATLAGDSSGVYEHLSVGLELGLGDFGWALALGVLAGALVVGRRLQRDTAGLV